MLNRRQLLATTAAAAALPAFGLEPAWADASQLNTLMDVFFQENLNLNPESATLLGLDKGDNAALKSRLRDESEAGIAAAKSLTASQMTRLKRIDAASLTGMDRVNYDTIAYTLDSRCGSTNSISAARPTGPRLTP